MNQLIRITRRGFCRVALGAAAAAGLGLGGSSAALAESDEPTADQIPELDPVLKSLDYQNPSPEKGRLCSNCVLYTSHPKAGHGRCAAFQNKLVQDSAWCLSWGPKPG